MSEQTDPVPATGGFDWRGTLGEAYAEHRALVETKGWKSPADALASYASLERLVGGERLTLPGRDARPEDWNAVWAKLGRPETPERYDLAGFSVPEGIPWDDGLQRTMLAEMHAAGLNSAQATRLLSRYAALATDGHRGFEQAAAAAAETVAADLRRDFGPAYEAKLDLANRAFRAAFGEQLDTVRSLRLADGSFLGDHPEVVRAFVRLGEMMGEDATRPAGKAAGVAASPAEALAEVERLKADAEFRRHYTSRDDPAAHRLAVERMNRLLAVAHGNGGER